MKFLGKNIILRWKYYILPNIYILIFLSSCSGILWQLATGNGTSMYDGVHDRAFSFLNLVSCLPN